MATPTPTVSPTSESNLKGAEMQQRYPECHCEDYPCCGHYDIIYGDENMPEYCDRCGGHHPASIDCEWEDEDDYEEDEDEDDGIDYRERHEVPAGILNLVEE
jgi:hypothetical protein